MAEVVLVRAGRSWGVDAALGPPCSVRWAALPGWLCRPCAIAGPPGQASDDALIRQAAAQIAIGDLTQRLPVLAGMGLTVRPQWLANSCV